MTIESDIKHLAKHTLFTPLFNENERGVIFYRKVYGQLKKVAYYRNPAHGLAWIKDVAIKARRVKHNKLISDGDDRDPRGSIPPWDAYLAEIFPQ